MSASKQKLQNSITGISFLDGLFPSQIKPVGLFGILGSTGTGITTTLATIAAEGVRRIEHTALPNQGVWAYITGYPKKDTELRLAANIAQVPLDKAWTGQLDDEEQSRLEEARSKIRDRVVIINAGEYASQFIDRFVSDSPKKNLLNGYLKGGQRLVGITVDDAGAIVDAESYDPDKIERPFQYHMTKFLNGCKRLAKTHGCPVFIGHHLRGAVGNKQPKAPLTHNDAQGFKKMGEHLDACFVLGNHARNGAFLIRSTITQLRQKLKSVVVKIGLGGARIQKADGPTEDKFYTDPAPLATAHCHPETLEAIKTWAVKEPQATPKKDDDSGNESCDISSVYVVSDMLSEQPEIAENSPDVEICDEECLLEIPVFMEEVHETLHVERE